MFTFYFFCHFTGVLFDATNSYDLPFYLAGVCFAVCALLLFTFPIIKYLRRENSRTDSHQQEQGQDNVAMEMESKQL